MAKKGLGKGLGAIFGEDVVKESKEELEKAKAKRAAAAEEIDEKRTHPYAQTGSDPAE